MPEPPLAAATSMSRSLANLDAVTIDGYGTLMTLDDPIPKLERLLPGRSREEIEHAFKAEGRYYADHAHTARDGPTLAQLHADCTSVFNATLGSTLTPEQYVGALEFVVLPGVVATLRTLRAHGLSLAVVANWDSSLHAHLERHDLRRWFDTVVVSGELGVSKPDPAPFRTALEHLGVEPERALHIGDDRPYDEEGARAAGLLFELAPLDEAVARWL